MKKQALGTDDITGMVDYLTRKDPRLLISLMSGTAAGGMGGYLASQTEGAPGETLAQRRKRIVLNALGTGAAGAAIPALGLTGAQQVLTAAPKGERDKGEGIFYGALPQGLLGTAGGLTGYAKSPGHEWTSNRENLRTVLDPKGDIIKPENSTGGIMNPSGLEGEIERLRKMDSANGGKDFSNAVMRMKDQAIPSGQGLRDFRAGSSAAGVAPVELNYKSAPGEGGGILGNLLPRYMNYLNPTETHLGPFGTDIAADNLKTVGKGGLLQGLKSLGGDLAQHGSSITGMNSRMPRRLFNTAAGTLAGGVGLPMLLSHFPGLTSWAAGLDPITGANGGGQ